MCYLTFCAYQIAVAHKYVMPTHAKWFKHHYSDSNKLKKKTMKSAMCL